MSGTADVATPEQWGDFFRSMAAFAQLVVVATPSEDISSISFGARLHAPAAQARTRRLGPGETWLGHTRSGSTASDQASASMQMPTTVLVRRSALRMAAWDMTVNQSISSVWALQPVRHQPRSSTPGLLPPPSHMPSRTGVAGRERARAGAECLQTIESFEQENRLARTAVSPHLH